MMKNITLRLHRQHDMDLISLYRTSGYHFGTQMKRVLIAYANGKLYEPNILEENDIQFAVGYVPTSVTFHIVLNENKEEEMKAIQLLTHIKNGYRNSFMKALFRSYIPFLPLIAFSKDNGLIMRRELPLSESYKMIQDTKIKASQINITDVIEQNENTIDTNINKTSEKSSQFESNKLITEKEINDSNNDNTVDVLNLKNDEVNMEQNDEIDDLFKQMSLLTHM